MATIAEIAEIAEMSMDELYCESKSLDHMIFEAECYSVSDIGRLLQVNEEINKRNNSDDESGK